MVHGVGVEFVRSRMAAGYCNNIKNGLVLIFLETRSIFARRSIALVIISRNHRVRLAVYDFWVCTRNSYWLTVVQQSEHRAATRLWRNTAVRIEVGVADFAREAEWPSARVNHVDKIGVVLGQVRELDGQNFEPGAGRVQTCVQSQRYKRSRSTIFAVYRFFAEYSVITNASIK